MSCKWLQNTPTTAIQRGKTPATSGPVSWGCRVHRLLPCRGVKKPREIPRYNTKQSDGDSPVIQELWEMRNITLLPLLPGPLWPEVVTPDRVLSMGQIELNCVFMLKWIVWNGTVLTFKMSTYAKLNCLK